MIVQRRLGSNSRVVRDALRGGYRGSLRMRRSLPPPRVFLNGIPKSGTHLARAVLESLPKMRYSGVHVQSEMLGYTDGRSWAPGDPASWEKVRRSLGRVLPGHFVTGHLGAMDEAVATVTELGFRRVVVVRDPRDILVSFALWVPRVPSHHLYARFTDEYMTTDSRIWACLNGIEQKPGSPGLEPYSERLRAYAGWLEDSGTLMVRFEDLIGGMGGGSRATQISTVDAIARHVSRPIARGETEDVADKIWNERSQTFRRGAIGDWRNHMTTAQLERLRADAADLLVTFGYEPKW